MAALGPAVGFVGEGWFVGQHAWWVFFLIFSVLGALLVYPILRAPQSVSVDDEETDAPVTPVSNVVSPDGLLVIAKECITNCTWVLSTMASSAQIIVVSGMTVYIPKYVSILFGFTDGQAAMLVGVCVVPGAAGGMLLGSLFVSKFHGSVRGAMNVCIVSTLLVAPCCMVWYLENSAWFSLGLVIMMVFTFANHVPNTHVVINVLSGAHQGTGMGLQSLMQRVLAAIPGPVIFGALVDNACAKWDGHCVKYDHGHLRATFMAATGLSSLVSGALFIAMWCTYNKTEDEVEHVELDEFDIEVDEIKGLTSPSDTDSSDGNLNDANLKAELPDNA